MKDEGVEIVDIRFCDCPTHAALFCAGPRADEDVFVEGLGFDGSSIRAFRRSRNLTCSCSRPATAILDRSPAQTLNLNCFVHDRSLSRATSRDPGMWP